MCSNCLDPKHTQKGAQKVGKKPRKSLRASVKDGSDKEGEEVGTRGRSVKKKGQKAKGRREKKDGPAKTGGGKEGGGEGQSDVSSRGFRSVPTSRGKNAKPCSSVSQISSLTTTTDEHAVEGLLQDSASESETEQPPVSDKIRTKHSSTSDVTSHHDTATKSSRKMKRQRRYILFVGNLPIFVTREEIVSHFEKRGVHIKEFRLLTHKDTGKSKGCGFMELGSDREMQNALKFHRMRMKQMHVNIEVTCGGGGKSEQRRAKIKEKNKNLRLKKALIHPVIHKAQN